MIKVFPIHIGPIGRQRARAGDGNQGELPAGALLVVAVITSRARRAGGPSSASSPCTAPSRPACRRSPPRRRSRGTSGGTGSVPAVLGAARYNLLTIGITNDESVGNALLASKAKADAFLKNPRLDQGPDDRADGQLHRRLRGAGVPREVGPEEGRREHEEHGPGGDHLRDVLGQRRPRRALGAQHLHARGEGRRQADLLRQRRRRDRAGRDHRAPGLRQGTAAERGQIPGRVSARARTGCSRTARKRWR